MWRASQLQFISLEKEGELRHLVWRASSCHLRRAVELLPRPISAEGARPSLAARVGSAPPSSSRASGRRLGLGASLGGNLGHLEGGMAGGALLALLAEDGQTHGAHKALVDGALVAEATRAEVHGRGARQCQEAAREAVRGEYGEQILQTYPRKRLARLR